MFRALSSALAIALLAAAPAALRAQTATQEQVTFTFKVPFTMHRLYPDVTEIEFSCGVKLTDASSWVGGHSGPRVSVASLTKSADGSVSGEVTVSVTATVPADAAGKSGTYACRPNGCINGSCSQLMPLNANTHLQVIADTPPFVSGTFVW